jgi:hypothetical protein
LNQAECFVSLLLRPIGLGEENRLGDQASDTCSGSVQQHGAYFVSSANPRIVDGKPSKNLRYLQLRPDLVNPRDAHLVEIGARLHRRISPSEALHRPVNAAKANYAEEAVRPSPDPSSLSFAASVQMLFCSFVPPYETYLFVLFVSRENKLLDPTDVVGMNQDTSSSVR